MALHSASGDFTSKGLHRLRLARKLRHLLPRPALATHPPASGQVPSSAKMLELEAALARITKKAEEMRLNCFHLAVRSRQALILIKEVVLYRFASGSPTLEIQSPLPAG